MVILLFSVLLYGPISKQTNLSSTPRFAVGSHQTAVSYQFHGESHPLRGSHATAPITCDGSRQEPLQRSDIRLDGSIIVLTAGHGHLGSHPILAADCFSLLAGKNKPKTLSF